jgi:hypothetical protein
MPYSVILEKNGFFTKWHGTVTTAEVIQMQEQAHAEPRFDFIHYSIHDFSECEALTYEQGSFDCIAAIDAAASKSNSQIKIAIITNNPAIAEAIKSYQNPGLSPFPMRLFANEDEARAWAT